MDKKEKPYRPQVLVNMDLWEVMQEISENSVMSLSVCQIANLAMRRGMEQAKKEISIKDPQGARLAGVPA